MATAFHFRAVASDGKPRTGTLTAENERLAAAEQKNAALERQLAERNRDDPTLGARVDDVLVPGSFTTPEAPEIPMMRRCFWSAMLTILVTYAQPGEKLDSRSNWA